VIAIPRYFVLIPGAFSIGTLERITPVGEMSAHGTVTIQVINKGYVLFPCDSRPVVAQYRKESFHPWCSLIRGLILYLIKLRSQSHAHARNSARGVRGRTHHHSVLFDLRVFCTFRTVPSSVVTTDLACFLVSLKGIAHPFQHINYNPQRLFFFSIRLKY